MLESIGGPKGTNWTPRIVCATLALALVVVWFLRTTQMPLHSFKGQLPPLSREQSDLANRLSADVKYLSATIGERKHSEAGVTSNDRRSPSRESSTGWLHRYEVQVFRRRPRGDQY
jgi:hypothetical protein